MEYVKYHSDANVATTSDCTYRQMWLIMRRKPRQKSKQKVPDESVSPEDEQAIREILDRRYEVSIILS